jgi:hypothetical protein
MMTEEAEPAGTEIEQPDLNTWGLALDGVQNDPTITIMAYGMSLFFRLDQLPSRSPIGAPDFIGKEAC